MAASHRKRVARQIHDVYAMCGMGTLFINMNSKEVCYIEQCSCFNHVIINLMISKDVTMKLDKVSKDLDPHTQRQFCF